MAGKLKVTGRSAGTIRHIGPVFRSVSAEEVAKALGAQEVGSEESPRGAPISLYALRQQLASRLRSKGGRPSLDGATRIQKIPLKPEDWARLGKVSAHLSRLGVSVTAGQVASAIVHSQLERIDLPDHGETRASRRQPRTRVMARRSRG